MNEYTIDANGVTLNGGRTWQDADHLNVRTESGTTNFHAEAKCAALPAPPECSPIMVSAASRIGESFIPWSDLGIDPASCIEWVQFSRANYHFGEAGEDPLCLTIPEPEPEPEKPLGYIPEVSKDCDGATWSHPATTTGVGAPARYEISIDGGPKVAYTPGEVVSIPWGEDATQAVVSLFGYYDSGFWHQIGQSRISNTETCEVVPPVDPPVEPPITPEPPVAPPVDTPSTEVVVPVSKPEQLAETGGVDPLGMILAAVVLVAGGAALLRKAVAR